MNSCIRHTNRGGSRAWRLILSRHSYDRDSLDLVADEIGDCGHCWRDVALAAVDAAHNLLLHYAPLPVMDAGGNCTGPTIDLILARIAGGLDAEAADRRDREQ